MAPIETPPLDVAGFATGLDIATGETVVSEKITLRAAPRAVIGKKVKQLRAEGMTPIVLYGPGIEPLALQAPSRHVREVLEAAGTTQQIRVEIEGDDSERTAIARDVDLHPTRLVPLHADFMQVRHDREVQTMVPLAITGALPGIITRNEAVLRQLVETLTVRAKPGVLPTQIEIDCSDMRRIGAVKRISDLDPGDGVRLIDDPHRAVVRVGALRRMAALPDEMMPDEDTEDAGEGGEGAESGGSGEGQDGSGSSGGDSEG